MKLKKQINNYFAKNLTVLVIIQTLIILFLLLSKSTLFTNIINVQRIFFLVWLAAVIMLKLRKDISFILALLFIIASSWIMIFDRYEMRAERFGDYAIGLIFIGAIQWVLEVKRQKNKNVSQKNSF